MQKSGTMIGIDHSRWRRARCNPSREQLIIFYMQVPLNDALSRPPNALEFGPLSQHGEAGGSPKKTHPTSLSRVAAATIITPDSSTRECPPLGKVRLGVPLWQPLHLWFDQRSPLTLFLAPRAVTILLKNTGDAPPLQEREVTANEDEPLAKVIAYLRRELGRPEAVVRPACLWV